ncbi:ABC transporter permease [Iodidimonas nitroreducens]|uniref:ABC transporter permease n=2 Tax=Iodidimonas nitroreducens TaxID=1236968 RepID=A0A5A7N9Q7_9PROT|nr:iron ABC transporter permease [Iodidimonas nitroreducens]GAK33106.1 putative ABC transporter permease protein YvrB [alpha proteobacterium Q-1]GER05093.1 ABC transporter permease [Iodidimonas nitroreducens]
MMMRAAPARLHHGALGLFLSLLVLVLFVLSLFLGPADLGLPDLFKAIDGDDGILQAIFWQIRLPRALLAVLVGGSLGLSGAALQGLLRNPLAEPGVIGVSASAGFGAVLALYFSAAGLSLSVPLAAMTGAFLATALLLVLARRDASVLSLILAGVAINALAGALTALALNLSPNPFALADMVHWLMGSFADRSHRDVMMAAPFIIMGMALLLLSGRGLRGLVLGEETAQSLGINPARLRLLVTLGAALCVGAGVAVAGAIGFVGLVVPHILRPWVGYDPARLLWPSALGGAALLLGADSLVRLLPGGQELKLGVVTALIGAPVFLHLIWSTRRLMR